MNVFFLTPWYPTNDHRYAGIFVREYAKAIQSQCNVIVLHCGIGDTTLARPWLITRELDGNLTAGIPSYRVKFRPSRIRALSFIRQLTGVHHAIATASKEHGPPDLIHGHVFLTGWAALWAAKSRRIPVVISEHWTAFPRGILSRFEIWQARSIFRNVDRVLPVSRALQKSIEGYGIKASFQIVPNVVDTTLFNPSETRPRSADLRLLVVTTLAEHKGLDVLLHALKDVAWQERDWQLHVVGDGPNINHYRDAAERLGLGPNVSFRGPLDRGEVAQLMATTDIFVLPSLFETFSVATAEALASGIPVVVTRCGGPEEFVSELSGTIVPPGNPTALTEAISNTIARLSEFDATIIARQAQANFNANRIGSMLFELYTRLTDRG